MEYLVFLKISLGLIGALSVSLYFWYKNRGNKIKKPIKTKDGNYLVENEKDLEKEVNYDAKIIIDLEQNPDYLSKTNSKLKNAQAKAIPNPSGPPPKGPIR